MDGTDGNSDAMAKVDPAITTQRAPDQIECLHDYKASNSPGGSDDVSK